MMVLVVEDEVIVGFVLAIELRMAGHRVIGPAGSADCALSLAAAEPPDLAFVDINLRGHAEGIAVARALRDRHGTTCVFLTAQAALAHNARDAAIGVIEKPYLPLTVIQAADYAAAVRTGTQLPAPPRGLALLQ